MWNRYKCFDSLVQAYSGDLYPIAYWLCRDRTQAEDLVQETYARAWKSLDSLKDKARAKAWLVTTLRRENARLYKRSRPDIADVELESLSSKNRMLDTSTDAFVLRRALSELSEDYRLPLILQIIHSVRGWDCGGFAVCPPSAFTWAGPAGVEQA